MRANKQAIALAASAIFALGMSAFLWGQLSRAQTEKITVLIASLVEIEPIAQLREGFKEEIARSSISSRVTYVERNAQNDVGLISQIASEVARTRPRVVYVLGTPLAQAIQRQSPATLLLQGAVSDPVEAGLADSWQGSGRPYAATSDNPPTGTILDTILVLTPDKRNLGVIYNPGESNSVTVVASLRTLASNKGFTLQEYGVGSISDLPTALTAALTRSNVLFIPPDNLVTSGLKAVIEAATTRKVPVYGTTGDAVGLGALAAVAANFRQLGKETADLMLSILVDGTNPASMPIQLPKNQEVVVSSKVALALGISLPSPLPSGYELK